MAEHQPSLPGLFFIPLAYPAVPAGLFFNRASRRSFLSPVFDKAGSKILPGYVMLVRCVFPQPREPYPLKAVMSC